MSDSDDESTMSVDSSTANPSHMDESSEEEEEPVVLLTPASHKALGNDSYKKGDYRAAIEHYTAAVEAQRLVLSAAAGAKAEAAALLASFLSNRSAAHMMILQHKQSIADCSAALGLDPTLNKIRLRMAKQLITVGRVDNGIDCYREALIADPNNAGALKEKDQALMILKRFEVSPLIPLTCEEEASRTREDTAPMTARSPPANSCAPEPSLLETKNAARSAVHVQVQGLRSAHRRPAGPGAAGRVPGR